MTTIYSWIATVKLTHSIHVYIFSGIITIIIVLISSSLLSLLRSSAYKQQGIQALLNPIEPEGPEM